MVTGFSYHAYPNEGYVIRGEIRVTENPTYDVDSEWSHKAEKAEENKVKLRRTTAV